MLKKFTTAFFFAAMLCISSFGQSISITTAGSPYNQNFNTLANSGTTNSVSGLPNGWTFVETGTGMNTTYAADNGSTNSGNTYSYGTTATTERALGSLQSGSVNPTLGVQFTNNTGSTVTLITVAYTGEQWRLGTAGRVDRLDFQYSTDATAVNSGTWTDVDNLDFTAPITAGAIGALDGNATANKTDLSFAISGLNIANGSTIWLRWSDFNASGADDGLAVDDFTIVFNGSLGAPCEEPTNQPTNLNLSSTPSSISGNFTAAIPSANEYLVVRSLSATLSAGPVDGSFYTAGQSLGGGTVVIATSGTSFTDNNLMASTLYYYFVFALNNQDCSGGPNYLQATPLSGSFATQTLAPCTTPTGASDLVLTPANNVINGNFTPSPNANRYLVVISTSATLSASPTNGTTYAAGQSLGGGTVVSFSTATSFSATGLSTSTLYYLFVFATNAECTGQPFYNGTALTGSATTTNNSTGIPVGFYDAAAGQSCQTLKTTLKNISSAGFVSLSYTPGVWNAYQYSDIKPSTTNIIWDIYTDDNDPATPETYNFVYGTNQCGNYSKEGDCYNREHSTPKSWFNDAYPMYSDVHHLFPTDGYVNSKRSNFPFGNVTNAIYTSIDNQSKQGTGNNYGYTGAVFEPHNAFKGDLARASLYMATRYEDEVISQNWAVNTAAAPLFLSAADQPDAAHRRLQVYETWYIKTMFDWMANDPVSQKEIDRNNAIYYQSGQSNRNPFVDHPEYAALIWQCTGVVPVTITNFKASKQNNTVLLTWYATYETNFKQYTIERSSDASNFYSIGDLAGRNLANYDFKDENLPAASIVYYRLKMIDIDGSSRYSKIVAVRLNNNFSNALVYPNPTRGQLNVKLTTAITSDTKLIITDVAGRVVKEQQVKKGQLTLDLDVKALPQGRYFIRINDGQTVITESFVVVK